MSRRAWWFALSAVVCLTLWVAIAHLDGWADDLKVGARVARGTPLGRVGNTGNARTTPPHLHFGVYRVGLVRSRAVDPFPLLAR